MLSHRSEILGMGVESLCTFEKGMGWPRQLSQETHIVTHLILTLSEVDMVIIITSILQTTYEKTQRLGN